MRKTSIDELPQLFNVLGGSMSLVGPRPHAIAHDNQFRSPATVNDQLEYLKLDAAEIITAYTVAARREPRKP